MLYNLICSRAVPEVIAESGGTAVRTKVGHSFIKAVMAETGAAFGGEHSGHYYFRDNYRADSGVIAALVVLEQMSAAGEPLSALLAPLDRYAASGEINTTVDDAGAVIDRVGGPLRRRPGPPRRPDRRLRRLVVQPPAQQHRTAAATEPRSPHGRRGGRAGRGGPRPVLTRPPIDCRPTPTAALEPPCPFTPTCSPSSPAPRTRGRSTTSRTSRALQPTAGRTYRIDDDIPVMLVDEAETVDDAERERLARQGGRASVARPPSNRDGATAVGPPGGQLDTLGLCDVTLGLAEQVEQAAGPPGTLRDGRPPTTSTRSSSPAWAGAACRATSPPRSPPPPARPVVVVKDYQCPAFVGERTLVFAVSFSGNTEETLEVAEHAHARAPGSWRSPREAGWPTWPGPGGCRIVAADPSIPMPRAGIGAVAVPPLVVLERVGLLDGATAETSMPPSSSCAAA